MKSVTQLVNELGGSNYSDFNYSSLYRKYARDIRDQEQRDLHAMDHKYSTFDKVQLKTMQKNLASVIDERAEQVNGHLPVSTTYDAYQKVKEAAKHDKRDVGLKVLATHLGKLWEKDREGSLHVSEYMRLKDHYANNFPKSAAVEVLDNVVNTGYTDLPMAKLMTIASCIRSQADYDYQIKSNGLESNSLRNKKARQFILDLVNGDAQ
jgi:hypothetical protein